VARRVVARAGHAASDSELLAIYPHRSDVPHDLWLQVFGPAEREIGVLVYAGLFLSEDRVVQRALTDKAKAGGAGARPAGRSGLPRSGPTGCR
jgi:hypothetical protein